MDSEELFWLKLWTMIIPAVLLFSAMLVLGNSYEKYLVANSDDPLRLECALSTSTQPVCLAYASERK